MPICSHFLKLLLPDFYRGINFHILCCAGPKTVLSAEQEQRLIGWIITMSKIGYGVTRGKLRDIVKEILNKAEKEDGFLLPDHRKFQDNRPSLNWVYRFLQRHPEASLRTPENFGFQRSFVTEKVIRAWFDELKSFLLEEHQIDAVKFFCEENASRVFNLDESGFPLQGTNSRLQVIAEKGSKNVYRLAPDTKEQITVLACTSASGLFSKPMVIYPGIRQPKYNFAGVNADDFNCGYSDNGWMTSEIFFTWLSSLFYPSVKDSVQSPIIIFLDGHRSHINLAVSEFCQQNDIILFCFIPHASHVLQPLDVSVFGPLKKEWNKAIDNFRNTYKMAVTRSNFFQMFDQAWKLATANPDNVKSGFKSTGIVPLNPNSVNYNKTLDKAAAQKWEKLQTVKSTASNAAEQVGLKRAFQTVENVLSDTMKKEFERRFDESYNIEDKTYKGACWKIYKSLRNLANETGEPETALFGAENNVQERPEAESLSEDAHEQIVINLYEGSATVMLKESDLAMSQSNAFEN